MSAPAVPARGDGAAVPVVPTRSRPILGWSLHDGLVVARRNLIQTIRVPELLFFSIVQPVIFVLLFAFVFGGAIPIPGSDPTTAPDASVYRQYLMPGIFGQTVAFASAAATVGLAEDMKRGIIDRFRSLPMASGGVLIGRTFADATRQILVLFVLSVTGLIIGWRINDGILNAIYAYALLLLFAYTVSWIGSWIGLYMPNPETANTAGLVWLFPLTFLSNAFVPITSMPAWLQPIAQWNPISSLVLSTRELFGNPTGIVGEAWPQQNPIAYTLISCAVLIAIFAPLAVRRYRTSTSR